MKDIDFLPPEYRQHRGESRQRVWRLTTLALFGIVIIAAASWQYLFHRAARRELARVDQQHAAALATHQQLLDLTAQLQTAEHDARLFAYLQHRWPRTQILAAIGREAGPTVQLSEITVRRETANRMPRVARPRGDLDAEQRGPAALRDLTALRSECDTARDLVTLTGTTSAATDVNTMVAMLSVSPLFEKAELVSLKSRTATPDLEFVVRLTVRPGYGQPGGPTAPSLEGQRTSRRSRP